MGNAPKLSRRVTRDSCIIAQRAREIPAKELNRYHFCKSATAGIRTRRCADVAFGHQATLRRPKTGHRWTHLRAQALTHSQQPVDAPTVLAKHIAGLDVERAQVRELTGYHWGLNAKAGRVGTAA
jgi:hypothetical protein